MKVYLDNAATTPLHPKVIEKMFPYLTDDFGNPSSIHSFGRKVRVAMEEARETLAAFINAQPGEIYFTSGGTEANNFAIFGIAKTEYNDSGRNHIITSKAEHHCVLESCSELENQGFNLSYADVRTDSSVDERTISTLISESTSLLSIIHINNETGTRTDLEKLIPIAKKDSVYFHSDAVQSFGKIPIDVKELGVDSISASAHKIYGPKGTGMTYAKSGTPLSPILFGGSQERNRRGGTENVAGIIGFAEAVKIANEEMEENEKHVRIIRNVFINGIKSIDSQFLRINGGDKVSPYLLSLTFSSEKYKCDAETMLIYLDINGIAASNGSACTSGTLKPSHVILSMGMSEADASGTIRFSFSPHNTIKEVEYTLEILNKMVKKFGID